MATQKENKKNALTLKQENFCLTYIETGNASEAYRKAYDAKNSNDATINRKAKELLDNGKITARIEQLRKPIIERHKITVDDLLKELDENRRAALSAETVQAAAATAATMAKAKLLGYDKQIFELTGHNGGPIQQSIVTPEQLDEAIKNGIRNKF